ncbi:MAG TPA: cardiolipin synthase [Bacillota bacterium]|nr:cardiolipin synthase [Bacillota bacterium]
MDLANYVTLAIPIINFLLAGLLLFIERRDPGTTWAWLMVLFFIPIVGFIVYLLFGRQLQQKNFYKLSSEERQYLKSSAKEQIKDIQIGKKFTDHNLLNKHAYLLLMNLKSSTSLITTDNEIDIFSDGHEKFTRLFADIQKATEEINIQYYIIQPDSLGKKLRDELTKKAKEGLTVRVLYDEIGSRKLTRSFFKELIDHGGEVEVFFPSLFKFINPRINNRNHRKLCIIDGKIGYIGGFNVGNEYLGKHKKFGYWRDTHLRITGGAVDQIQGRFILDWKEATKQKETHFDRFLFRTEPHSGNSPVQIIDSGPNSETEHIKNMYIKLIMSAKKSVFIQTPYFIPDSSFMDACKVALLAGVDVRIMIPNKPDHPFVYWATLAYAGDLLSYGAKILIYENGFMHAKTIVVDGEVASVGTTNIDTRSFKLNFEVNAVIYDQNVANELQQLFLRDREHSTKLTMETYNKRSLLIRFKEGISRLLSPIL